MIDWLSLAFVLAALGALLCRSGFRLIDLLGTQALARWPMLLGACALLLPGYSRTLTALMKSIPANPAASPPAPAQLLESVDPADLAMFAGALLILLLATGWFVALAWQSFRISCDARGGKAVAAYVAGLIVAEIVSKAAIAALVITALR